MGDNSAKDGLWGVCILLIIFLVAVCASIPLTAWGEETPPVPDDNPPRLLVRERTVYVPYDKLRDTFEKAGRGVFLPYEEFQKLWNAAQPQKPPEKLDEPPAEAVITGGSYTGTVKDSIVRFEVTYEIKSLAKKWSTLDLPLRNVAIESVNLSNPKAVFVPRGIHGAHGKSAPAEGYVLVMPEAGTYTVSLAFSVRIDAKPGQRTFSFGIPPTAISRLDLTIPEMDVKVDVVPQMAATTTEVKGDQTRLLAFVGDADHVTVTWKPSIDKVEKGTALAIASQMMRADLGERVLRLGTTIYYKIERNEAEGFRLKLPDEMRLLSVKGPNIRTWKVDGGELRVDLHSSVKDAYELRLQFERVLTQTPEKLAIPFPQVLDVLREDGYMILTNVAGLRVRVEGASGLSQVDPRELPAELKTDDLLAGFRYLAHPLALNLSLKPIEPEVRGTVQSVVALGLDEDQLIGSIDLKIAQVGIFKARIRFEKRWEVLSIGDDQLVEDLQIAEEGEYKVVTVNLKSRAMGTLNLPFQLSGTGRAQEGEFVFSPPSLPDAIQEKGVFGISAPKAFKVTTLERNQAVPASVQQLFASGLVSKLSRDMEMPLAYAYHKQPAAVKVALEKRQTEIRVSGSHVYTIAESGLETSHTLRYLIEFAGVDALRFSVPQELDEKIHVVSQNLKEKKKIDTKNGRSIWEVKLQEKTLGEVTLQIRHKKDLDDLEEEKAREVVLPDVRAEEVKSEQGYIAVRKEGSLEVKPKITNLEPVEPSNLPAEMRHRNIYLSYRYFQPERVLALHLTRHVQVELVHTVVDLLRETKVLSEEKVLLVRSELYVENVQGEQYLELQLPKGSFIRSLAINGTPSTPLEKKGGGTLVKLPTGGPFPIELIYVTKIEAPVDEKMGWMGGFALSSLTVAQMVPVNKVEVDLFVPEDYAYLGFGGTLHMRSDEDVVSNSLAWVRDALRGRHDVQTIHQGGTAEFQAPRGLVGKFTTQGRLYRFHTLAPVGTLEFSYCGRKTFWLINILVFLAALGLGWFLAERKSLPRFWVAATFVIVPLCIQWFLTSDASEPFLAWLAAGLVLTAVFVIFHLRSRLGMWQEQKLSMAPDPYLDEDSDLTESSSEAVDHTGADGEKESFDGGGPAGSEEDSLKSQPSEKDDAGPGAQAGDDVRGRGDNSSGADQDVKKND